MLFEYLSMHIRGGNKNEIFQNDFIDGKVDWPVDVRLQYTNGTHMGDHSKSLDHVVKPGEFVDISVNF